MTGSTKLMVIPKKSMAGKKTLPAKKAGSTTKTAKLGQDQDIKVIVYVVMFAFEEQQLKFVLIRSADEPYGGLCAFPGGYLKNDEVLEAGVLRELKEQTGLGKTGSIRLKQIMTVGPLKKDARGRSISVFYLGAIPLLVDEKTGKRVEELKPMIDSIEADYHPVKKHPILAFDHEQITKQLLSILKEEALRTEILFDFFRSVIPASDMLSLVEQVWGTTADRRKWDAWMRSLPFLQEMSGGEKYRLDRTEMRRWLRTHQLDMSEIFPQG